MQLLSDAAVVGVPGNYRVVDPETVLGPEDLGHVCQLDGTVCIMETSFKTDRKKSTKVFIHLD